MDIATTLQATFSVFYKAYLLKFCLYFMALVKAI